MVLILTDQGVSQCGYGTTNPEAILAQVAKGSDCRDRAKTEKVGDRVNRELEVIIQRGRRMREQSRREMREALLRQGIVVCESPEPLLPGEEFLLDSEDGVYAG